MFWWCNAFYNMTLALVKLSLLLQYLRLIDEQARSSSSGGNNKNTRRLRAVVVALIVIVSIWGAIWTVVAWIPCAPISAHWDFSGAVPDTATRWGYGSRDVAVFVATFYNHASTNMVLDILVVSLPLLSTSLWATAAVDRRSQMGMLGLFVLGALYVSFPEPLSPLPLPHHTSTLPLFCLSLFFLPLFFPPLLSFSLRTTHLTNTPSSSVACSVVRFAYIIKTKATTYPTFDPTWYGTYSTVLSVVEVDLATVVASLPVFWPHLRRNIASILITHEIEVKITRKSDFFLGGGGGMGGSNGEARRNTRNVGAHWDLEVGGGGTGGGRGNGVRLSDRDEDPSGGGRDAIKNGGGGAAGGSVMMRDLGFGDGPRRSGDMPLAEIKRPQRANLRLQPASRESMKEMLLN